MRWSPFLSNASRAEVMAAMPEEKARPASAPSSAAIFSSTAVVVGFPIRE